MPSIHVTFIFQSEMLNYFHTLQFIYSFATLFTAKMHVLTKSQKGIRVCHAMMSTWEECLRIITCWFYKHVKGKWFVNDKNMYFLQVFLMSVVSKSMNYFCLEVVQPQSLKWTCSIYGMKEWGKCTSMVIMHWFAFSVWCLAYANDMQFNSVL